MRKAKGAGPLLKAHSLADLRRLRNQAARPGAAPTGGDARAFTSEQDEPTRMGAAVRKPHRFLPPGAGKRVGAPAPAAPWSATAPGDSPAQPAHVLDGPGVAPAATLDPADAQLFRRVMHDVIPAAASNRAILPPVPAATPDLLRQRRTHAMGEDTRLPSNVSDHYAPAPTERDDTVYLRAGHGPDLIKGLQKGRWPAQATLDLHGANLDAARERLDRFIQSCREHQLRSVRIVHGKGYGSKNGDSVLKETVRRWLTQLSAVQAYTECSEADGGAGAVQVLLEKAGL